MFAVEVTTFTEKVGVPIVVALVGLIGALGAAALTFAFTRLSEAAARRRDGYAEAAAHQRRPGRADAPRQHRP